MDEKKIKVARSSNWRRVVSSQSRSQFGPPKTSSICTYVYIDKIISVSNIFLGFISIFVRCFDVYTRVHAAAHKKRQKSLSERAIETKKGGRVAAKVERKSRMVEGKVVIT